MAVREKEDLVIIGSHYMVRSQGAEDETLLSTGEFRGFAAFASETALVLKLDGSNGQEEGRIRFLPYHAILSIDVLKMASGQVQDRKEDNQVYYR
jgi:hypothetical protein